MTLPEEQQPAARRRRLDTPEPPDEGRRGCLWLGGVLGVIAGVLFTFLAMPHILDWAFQPERVAVGETLVHEGRIVTVRDLREVDPTPTDVAEGHRWRVVVDVTANRSWTIELDTFELRLENGTEVATAVIEGDLASGAARLPLGEQKTLSLYFAAPNDSPPSKLLLDEPQAEFDLPVPSQP